jgi:uncharacterized protein YegJ (DUF2314 family)
VKVLIRTLFCVPVVLLVASCASDTGDRDIHPLGREVTRVPGDAAMFAVKEDDAQMERATRHARRTVREFITALNHPVAGERDFQVKKLFVQGNAAEHIWLANVKFTGNRFVGEVDNKPVSIKGLKVGTRVSVNPDEITDWSYVHNGHLVGGYTIRVLYSELSPQERVEFLKSADFKIGR